MSRIVILSPDQITRIGRCYSKLVPSVRADRISNCRGTSCTNHELDCNLITGSDNCTRRTGRCYSKLALPVRADQISDCPRDTLLGRSAAMSVVLELCRLHNSIALRCVA
jgi:hypothetical protein